ncbi:MAG: immunity protein YezG family protein [Cryomorphaceae bacterium]
MSILKKLFGNRNTSPGDKIGEKIQSMVEICAEYVGFDTAGVDNIYIFTTIEESQYVNFCFRIKGEIIKKHRVNDFLVRKVNVDPSAQKSVLDMCNEEVVSIKEVFKKEGRELFKHLKIAYDTKTKKMNSSFDYDSLLIGTELTPHDIEEKWLDSLK